MASTGKKKKVLGGFWTFCQHLFSTDIAKIWGKLIKFLKRAK
jgi:hypothetical protein